MKQEPPRAAADSAAYGPDGVAEWSRSPLLALKRNGKSSPLLRVRFHRQVRDSSVVPKSESDHVADRRRPTTVQLLTVGPTPND